MKLNLKYASEVLGEIEKYPKGSIILAKLQTGTGKTTAIIGADEILGLMDRIKDETIIYLCNRWALKNQVKLSLCKKENINIKRNEDGAIDYKWLESQKTIGNVTVMSYQELQEIIFTSNKIKHDNPNDWYMRDDIFNLGDYNYIVADEFHYIVRDAGFNAKTMLSYKEFLKTWYDESVLLLLTATDCEVKTSVETFVDNWCELTNSEDFIKAFGKNKVFKRDYYKYMDGGIDYSYLNIKYFKCKSDMITTIKNSDKKWMWFVSSVPKGKSLTEELKSVGVDADFVSSNENLKLKQDIIENERFECKVLVTTSVLDNGINIKDDEVVNIIIESFDEVTFIQMLGRKRINILNAQCVNLYIPMRNSSHYTKKIEQLEDKMKIIRLFYENKNKFEKKTSYNLEKLQGAFYKDYDNELCINETYSYRLVKDMTYYKDCARALNDDCWFFIKEQLRWLGMEHTFDESNLIENVISDREVEALEKFLKDNYEDDSLFTKEVFRETIDEIINNDSKLLDIMNKLDGKHTRDKGQRLYNKLFMKLGFNYRVFSKPKEEKINGKRVKKTYWIIGLEEK